MGVQYMVAELMADPKTCDHPLEHVELIWAKVERSPSSTPVFSTSHAVVKCHKCGSYLRMISDYGDWNNERAIKIPILPMPR